MLFKISSSSTFLSGGGGAMSNKKTGQWHRDYPSSDSRELEGIFATLGLRSFGRVGASKHAAEGDGLGYKGPSGYTLLISSILLVLAYLYAALFSKLMPTTGVALLDAIKEDEYFCFLLPLLIIPTFFIVYLNWVSFQLL